MSAELRTNDATLVELIEFEALNNKQSPEEKHGTHVEFTPSSLKSRQSTVLVSMILYGTGEIILYDKNMHIIYMI